MGPPHQLPLAITVPTPSLATPAPPLPVRSQLETTTPAPSTTWIPSLRLAATTHLRIWTLFTATSSTFADRRLLVLRDPTNAPNDHCPIIASTSPTVLSMPC